MEKKNKWKVMILPAVLFLLAVGLYAGFTMFEAGNGKVKNKTSNDKDQTVAVFKEESGQENYETVGRFISEFHTKYNDTLGWGGIDSVEWDKQREIASEILTVLSAIETSNADLQADFDKISSYSRTISDGTRDKKILRNLHRYFHDLDVEFNDYSKTNDYFNMTKYKG